MRTLTVAVATAAVAAAGAAPAAAQVPPPPTDPIHVEGGNCPPPEPGYPCDPQPTGVAVDKTYPKRLLVWATDLLP